MAIKTLAELNTAGKMFWSTKDTIYSVGSLQVGQTFWWKGDEYRVVKASSPYDLHGATWVDVTVQGGKVITLRVQ